MRVGSKVDREADESTEREREREREGGERGTRHGVGVAWRVQHTARSALSTAAATRCSRGRHRAAHLHSTARICRLLLLPTSSPPHARGCRLPRSWHPSPLSRWRCRQTASCPSHPRAARCVASHAVTSTRHSPVVRVLAADSCRCSSAGGLPSFAPSTCSPPSSSFLSPPLFLLLHPRALLPSCGC